MNTVNVKCPNCGELFTTENTTRAHCEKCGEDFLTDKGAKFYKSFVGIERKKVAIAKGEAFLKVDSLLDEANYYLDLEEYEKADEICREILTYTEVDFRVYLAMVLAKTKNFTNLDDVSHIPYLKKAIDVANDEQKTLLRARYKDFYQKQSMSPDELQDYKEQEANHSLTVLEKLLKDGIPHHFKRESSKGIYKILSIVLTPLTIAVIVLSLIFNNVVLYGFTVAFSIAFLTFLFLFITSNEKTSSFNLALDIFDNFTNFNLPFNDKRELVKELTEFATAYLNGSSDLYLTTKVGGIVNKLEGLNNLKVEKFLSQNKYAKKFAK